MANVNSAETTTTKASKCGSRVEHTSSIASRVQSMRWPRAARIAAVGLSATAWKKQADLLLRPTAHEGMAALN